MTDAVPTTVPAGWYDDPADLSTVRWWSGVGWTEHTSPKQPPAPPLPTPAIDPWAGERRAAPQPPVLDYDEFSRDPAVLRDQGRRTDLAPEDQAARYAATRSTRTAGVWLLAFHPLLTLAMSIGAAALVVTSGTEMPAYVVAPLALAVAWLFAAVDVRSLKRRGFHPPSVLWMLLVPPLAYFIARGRTLRSQRGRVWPPELAYFANVLAIAGAAAVIALAVPQLNPLSQTPPNLGDTPSVVRGSDPSLNG